ncbi:MAG: MBG domain-containing protein, partial [Acidimicrobiales bacterium]
AYVYTEDNGTWSSSPQGFPGSSGASFGQSVALSADGTEALVGAPGNSGAPGSAYLYTATAGTWSSAPNASFAGSSAERLGWSVALSADGGKALVGAPAFASSDGGEANLYTKGAVSVEVSGSQTYGPSSAQFTYAPGSVPSGVSITGTLDCSSVNGGTAIEPTLAADTYTVDGSSCQGLSLTGADAAGYTIIYTGASDGFTIYPAPLAVIAPSATMTYGGTVPDLSTPSYSGFVNQDTSASLTTQPICTTTATNRSPVNTYSTTCSGPAVDGNYAMTYLEGTLRVQPAPLTITASSPTVLQGSAIPPITASYVGFVNGDGPTSLTPPPTCLPTPTAPTAPGTYPTTCSGALDPNYTINYVGGTLTIEPPLPVAPAFTSVSSADATVGMPFSFTVTATGSPVPSISKSGALPAGVTFTDNGDGSATLAGTPADGDVGSYPMTITASNVGGAPTQSFELTVAPAPLTMTASSASMTYGDAVPTTTASYSGLVNGDTALTTPPKCTTNAPNVTSPALSPPAGKYTTSCTGASDPNYDISAVDGSLTVNPAHLTITAPTLTMTEGAAVPAITPTYARFVNGDTASSLTTAPTCSTTATSSSPLGTYPTSCSGAVDGNYAISYVDGTLTVNAAPATGGTAPISPPPGFTPPVPPPPAPPTTTPPPPTTRPPTTPPPATKAAHSPELTSLSPSAGPNKGGTRVVIRGSSLSRVTTVRFGSRAASFEVVSAQEIIARSPKGIGTVPVNVRAAGGTSASAKHGDFTYLDKSQVTYVSPSAGPGKGGTRVVIRGHTFKDVEEVHFGSHKAASFKVVSAQEIIARAPKGTGSVAIRVTTPGGTSGSAKRASFTYLAKSQVAHLSPAAGPDKGGTKVVVRGSSFKDVTEVVFGKREAHFEVVSAHEVVATSPGGTGTVAVRVTTPAGTSAPAEAGRFTYRASS